MKGNRRWIPLIFHVYSRYSGCQRYSLDQQDANYLLFFYDHDATQSECAHRLSVNGSSANRDSLHAWYNCNRKRLPHASCMRIFRGSFRWRIAWTLSKDYRIFLFGYKNYFTSLAEAIYVVVCKLDMYAVETHRIGLRKNFWIVNNEEAASTHQNKYSRRNLISISLPATAIHGTCLIQNGLSVLGSISTESARAFDRWSAFHRLSQHSSPRLDNIS